jgi:hypothetical protein
MVESRVQHRKTGQADEVVCVSRDKRQAVFDSGGSEDQVWL